MPGALLTLICALILVYAVFARRAIAWNLSAAMLALVAGIVVFSVGHIVDLHLEEVHLLAEVTLVLVLFHDASTVKYGAWARRTHAPIEREASIEQMTSRGRGVTGR